MAACAAAAAAYAFKASAAPRTASSHAKPVAAAGAITTMARNASTVSLSGSSSRMARSAAQDPAGVGATRWVHRLHKPAKQQHNYVSALAVLRPIACNHHHDGAADVVAKNYDCAVASICDQQTHLQVVARSNLLHL
jgi:hypothetical protein